MEALVEVGAAPEAVPPGPRVAGAARNRNPSPNLKKKISLFVMLCQLVSDYVLNQKNRLKLVCKLRTVKAS
jgi:hypothetical protein